MQKASTEEEWEAVASTFIPLRGELCVVFMTSGGTQLKVGDGTTTFANLPYVTGDTVDLSAFVTAEDPSAEVEGTLAETFGGHTVEDFVLKNGGTMEGALIAQSNSNYTQRQVRNIILSTTEPSAGDGQDGDIWLIYEA